jgi:FG-GAP-like repeat/Abnormal spindle-like microcephaly-assoc'd, ASPM-SPD-2-Hydin
MHKCVALPTRILSCFALLICFAFHAGAQTPNPIPYLNQPVLPDSVVPGGPSFTLTVTGSEFVSGAHVNWNGSSRATTFVSGTQLTATILASDIAKPSTAFITVTNPSPGGGISNFQFLSITSLVSSPTFARTDESLGQNVGNTPSSPVLADFNGDGILDIAMAVYDAAGCLECQTGSESICVALGVGDGTFHAPNCFVVDSNFASGGEPAYPALQAADMNGDGKIDLVYLDTIIGTLDVLLGNGDGTFQAPIKTTPPSGTLNSFVAVGDFNNDGKLDVIALNFLNPTYEVLEFLGNGDGTFSTPTVIPGSGFTSAVAGDFNRDGNLDLAFLGSSDIDLLLGNGDGTFQSPLTIPAPQGSLSAGDFNNDGNLDLLVISQQETSNSYIASVFLGNGDGTFRAPKTSPAPSNGFYSVMLGDMNGDGNLDFVLGQYQAISVELGNGDGTFKAPISVQPASAFSGAFLLGDFNRDGMMDILSINSGDIEFMQLSPVTISLDIQGLFPIAELSAPTLTFNDIGLGTQQTMPVTLTNTGSAPLAISSISISGSPKADELTQTNNCGSSLAANASCTITVTFFSLGGGNITASLLIADNASGSPQSVAITAPSDDFVITSNTASTVTVNPGQSATYGITVTGLVDFEGNVALSCSGAPSGSSCTVSPGSVNATANPDGPQGTATVTVSTTPNTSTIAKPPSFPSLTPMQLSKFALCLIAISIFLLAAAPRRRSHLAGFLAITLFILGMVGMSSCGGGGSSSNGNGTPAGTYTITITGKFVGGTTLTHTKQLTLVVK